jgi:hypothetical protein
MENHVNLLLYEQKNDITKIMKRIGVRYAWWYEIKRQISNNIPMNEFVMSLGDMFNSELLDTIYTN